MKTVKLPKFDPKKHENSSGHTNNEWGTQDSSKKTRVIEAYTVIWDD